LISNKSPFVFAKLVIADEPVDAAEEVVVGFEDVVVEALVDVVKDLMEVDDDLTDVVDDLMEEVVEALVDDCFKGGCQYSTLVQLVSDIAG